MPDLALTIKLLREARQLSLSKVAERASLNIGFVSQLESGQRNASAETLVKLAEALRVPPRLLLYAAGMLNSGEIDARSKDLATTLDRLERLELALQRKLGV